MPSIQRVSQYRIPDTDTDLEKLCKALYGAEWRDPTIMIMGRSGQTQHGVDILGYDGQQPVGIQCKCFTTTPLNTGKIDQEIKRAEDARLDIRHLIIATTKPNDAKLVRHIHDLNQQRRANGTFVVSLASWDAIEALLDKHPEVARHYDPRHPKSQLQQVLAHVEQTGPALTSLDARFDQVQASIGALHTRLDANIPARGDETDSLTVRLLDQVRDCIRAGDSLGAEQRLASIGDPANLRDAFSRFRWHLNRGTVYLLHSDKQRAASEWLQAFTQAPDNEKAHANRIHAYVLQEDYPRATELAEEALLLFPGSPLLWRIKITVQSLQGITIDEADIPVEMRDLPDILFARAVAHSRDGQTATALALLERCRDLDPDCLDNRRCYLAEVLSWMNEAKISTHFGNLKPEQRDALDRAIEGFEPIERSLSSMTSPVLLEELYNNLAAALRIRGETERATRLADHGWQLGYHCEELLRLRLIPLEEAHDYPAIKTLLCDQIATLSLPMLVLAAQSASNSGDICWFNDIHAVISTRSLTDDLQNELEALRVNAIRHGTGDTAALTEAMHALEANPDNPMMRILCARLLEALNRREEALDQALTCLATLEQQTLGHFHAYQLAELFFDLEEFHVAAPLYERLVQSPDDDYLTRRLGRCLIETHQRQKAEALLDALPQKSRQQPSFLQMEANLATAIGDFARMVSVLEPLLKTQPTSPQLTLNYAIAAYRAKDADRLQMVLQTAPLFSEHPAVEFQLAKMQAAHGLGLAALQRMYCCFRQYPSSAEVAGYFQVVWLQSDPALHQQSTTVGGTSCVVTLSAGTQSREVVIDREQPDTNNRWVESVDPLSELSLQLTGKAIGDAIVIRGPAGETSYTVTNIEAVWPFAARKALHVIESSPENAGPVWTFPIIRDDGEVDVERLLEIGGHQKEFRRRQFEHYSNSRMTVGKLAEFLHTDIPSLLLAWPADVAALNIDTGNTDERDYEAHLLTESHCVAIDLLTLLEIRRRGLTQEIAALFGRPLVARTIVNQLELYISQPALLSLEFADCRDSQAQGYTHALPLIDDTLKYITEHCDVVCARGPDVVEHETHLVSLLLDPLSFDTLLLAQENQAILLSDDLKYRRYVRFTNTPAIGLQGVMTRCALNGLIDPHKHASILLAKYREGHHFISVNAPNLIALAAAEPDAVASDVLAIIQNLRDPSVLLSSALHVAKDFLLDRFWEAPLDIFASYVEQVESALLADRPPNRSMIRRWARALASAAITAAVKRDPTVVVSRLEKISECRPSDPNSDLAIAIRQAIASWR